MHVGDCILTVAGLEMVSDVTEVIGEGVYTVITMEVSECENWCMDVGVRTCVRTYVLINVSLNVCINSRTDKYMYALMYDCVSEFSYLHLPI